MLFNENPLVVNVELARILGLNESIVIQQIHYWLEINKKKNHNYRDGKYWTYNTYPEWHEQFPFWSESTIKRIMRGLEKEGYIISTQYNKKTYDKTKWYTIDYEKIDLLVQEARNNRMGQNDPIDSTKMTSMIGS